MLIIAQITFVPIIVQYRCVFTRIFRNTVITRQFSLKSVYNYVAHLQMTRDCKIQPTKMVSSLQSGP